ncbi:glycosyltransferase family 4 protein [Glutamicibacter nicotianae]|uniref:glycosyltransferase family 4 protein n=1 Tax=Glutamicibacter nicotianae TaxID=37929 RepID=UPI00195E1DD1|nr:glycosyltransferase family 4 protein [Glutamicibacter nicotianae]MBM7768244.1 glycosyltransferase involved in cell wall biosynthesis [Glutamicibacter nicotianae]
MNPKMGYFTGNKAQNVRNVLRLIGENLFDDPQYFCLQAVRKFAKSQQLKCLEKLRSAPLISGKFDGLVALLSEDRTAVAQYLASQKKQWNRPSKAARLADTAIAAQLWDLAAEILDSSPVTKATAKSKARLEFSLGNLDEAINLLSSMGNSKSRQLKHYRSEFRVLESWNPVANSKKRDWELNGTTRVLYIATNSLPFTASGYTQRTHSLLLALQDEDVEVHAVTRVGYPMSIGHALAESTSIVDGISYHRLLPAHLQFDTAGRIQQQTQMLSALVEQLKPTVLHTTTDFTNALAVRAVARSYNLPWVYEVRGQLADTWASTRPAAASGSQRYRLFQAREAELAASATEVLTLGQAMRDNLEHFGVSPEKITVIPNGVGHPFVDEPLSAVDARTALGLDPHAEYFGTVSSLVAYEGLDMLVRVMAMLANRRPDLYLVIVGDGVEREVLMRLARELGVGERCIFTGRVSRQKAAKYHAALDVFAVPRRDLSVTRDVTPLKPVEAMASAVPVMASKLPALEELIRDGVDGVLLPPGDDVAWSETLENLLVDPSFRQQLGQSGREKVLSDRTWAVCSRKLKRIYSQ